MPNITNLLNVNTGENIQAITVTEWAPPGLTPVPLNSGTENLLGGLYNKLGDDYIKWQVAGGFPVSRLTIANENNFKKLVADFGTAPAIIILDKTIPVAATITVPQNITIEYINGAYFNTPTTPFTANVYVDVQSTLEVTLEQFGGVGDGKVYDGVGSITVGEYILYVSEPIFSLKDVGKSICIQNAGVYTSGSYTTQSALSTTITGFTDSTHVTIATPAVYTVSNVRVSFGTDNTQAFYRYNRWARNMKGMITLNLGEGKTYVHKTIRWGYNIVNQIVNGNGASLINVATNAWDRASLTTASALNGESTDSLPPVFLVRYLINTVQRDNVELHLTDIIQSADFIVGEWVMVASSLLNFDGFPPNYRYFDYVKIVSVDAVTGKIGIDRPLKYTHRSDALWSTATDTTLHVSGRASILRLEVGSKFGITHIYNDLSFYCHTLINNESPDPVRAKGWHVEFNRCNFDAFVPSNAETIITNNCIQKGLVNEFDKLVTHFTDTGSTWKRLAGGNSIINAVFNNSKFDSLEGLTCRNLTFNGCSKTGANTSVSFSIGARGGGTKSFVINGGIYNQAPQQSLLFSQMPRATIGSGGVSYSGTVLTVPTTLDYIVFLVNMTEGTRIDVTGIWATQPGVALGVGNYGIVDAISSDGTNTYITIVFKKPIVGGESLAIYYEPAAVSIKNATIAGTFVKEKKYLRISREMSFEDVTVISNYSNFVNMIGGSAIKIIVDVKKPYTGTSTDALLRVLGSFPTTAVNQDIFIDLTRVGRRELTPAMSIGRTGNDVMPVSLKISDTTFKSLYWVRCTSALLGATTDLPVVDFYIQNYAEALETAVSPIAIETAPDGTNNNTPASTAFVVRNSGRVIPDAGTPTGVTKAYLNTTYPVATYPIGTEIRYYNIGKVYRRETATVWSEYVIALTI
jgi:hypothetical protein